MFVTQSRGRTGAGRGIQYVLGGGAEVRYKNTKKKIIGTKFFFGHADI